jgi:hypothetical protein
MSKNSLRGDTSVHWNYGVRFEQVMTRETQAILGWD